MSVLLVLVAPALSSCFSYKSLTKKDPITREFLSKLEPGKKYAFKLKTNDKKIVFIATVGPETISGYTERIDADDKVYTSPYSESFDTIELNVTKISIRKHRPGLTASAIVIGVASHLYLGYVMLYSYYN